MPIYAYKCESCGHRQDVLQKISDPLLTVCPACGASAYVKQVTAAGFQLKGSGWYVTDFRDGGTNKGGAAEKVSDKSSDNAGEKTADKPAEAGKPSAPVPAAAESSSGASAPSPAPAAAPPPAAAS